jgi:hypothetical protein
MKPAPPVTRIMRRICVLDGPTAAPVIGIVTRALRRVLVLAAAISVPSALRAQVTATYEYAYPYNTPDLIENHFIVLETSSDGTRGWYYGTSDEFDSAREGYLPGFFVAPMLDLRLGAAEISFTLRRPARFFTSPVPLAFRDPADVPTGRLEEWGVSLPTEAVAYSGARAATEISLAVPGGARVFHLR